MKHILVFLLIAAGLFASRPCLGQQAVFRVGDTLEIRLAGVPSEEIGAFSAPQTIDDEGMVNLPYIGKIKIVGMDASQAQRVIETRLQTDKIYTHPTVTLNMQTNTRLVNVTGEVKSSGRISYTSDMTVMSAIAAAGGFSDYADKKRVKLVRNGKMRVCDTTKFTAKPELDEKVLPGDQLYVPQSSGLPFGL